MVESVRNERKTNKTCLSAQEGANVPEFLKQIVATGFYKQDYNETTSKLLTKMVSYDDAIESLQAVVESGLFEM